MQLPFRKTGRSNPPSPVEPIPGDPSLAESATTDSTQNDRPRPNTFPFTQHDLPKTDSRSWQSTFRKPSFKSRSRLRTSKSVPIDLNKLSKDKPLPPTPRKTKAEIRAELAVERMKKDQEEFLRGCAAAAVRIEAMGGLMEYHDAQKQRQEEDALFKKDSGEKKFKWMRR